nr:juvenile hormone epoxide hydrolase 1-like [Penaeus vannamei]XP_027223681.1 juvenile hormone epoxide hydrolase 1-like [Penaeus vannamei]
MKMAFGFLLASVLAAVVVAYILTKFFREPEMPSLPQNPWWGEGEPQAEDTAIRPFTINIPDEDLEDLRLRLALPLRLTPPLEGANFTYGTNSDTLKHIVEYWRKEYHWKEREAKMNELQHFKTQIEGLDIHFVHARPQQTPSNVHEPIPLLLIHGWPGSFVEFLGILPLLTSPGEGSGRVFEVICPSLPGYGFSQAAAKPGLGLQETAQIFLKLMKRLGHSRFYVQGGDWGAGVATQLATLYPQHLRGVHLNMFRPQTTMGKVRQVLGAFLPSGTLMAKEEEGMLYPLLEHAKWLLRESGYFHIQATKPDTLGAALAQSPVGLASYLLEKFSTWTNGANVNKPDGGLLKGFPIALDALLDDICIYWFTNSITSSMRYYAENMSRERAAIDTSNIPSKVPAGLAAFPEEVLLAPRSLMAHKFHDIVTYTRPSAGGHFAAMEQPGILARDFRAFVEAVEAREGR